MARTRKRSAIATALMPAEPALEPLVERLQELVKVTAENRAFKSSAPWVATVLMPDGITYKRLAISNEEFFWSGIRLGKRGDLVFEFEPVDSRPFARMEMVTGEVIEGRLAEFHAFVCANLGVGSLAEAKRTAKRWAKEQIAEAKAVEQQAVAVKYEDNPKFGSW